MGITLRWRDPAYLSVHDRRRAARRRLPELAWNYVDGGADDHVRLDANVAGFRGWRLRQRRLGGIGGGVASM